MVSNPLDGGLATGKYTATTPNGGLSGGPVPYKFEMLEELAPLHSVQETVAEKASSRVKKEQRDFKATYKRYGPAVSIRYLLFSIASSWGTLCTLKLLCHFSRPFYPLIFLFLNLNVVAKGQYRYNNYASCN